MQNNNPTPALNEECDHEWFDCSNAVITAPTKSCRKCGWTVHGDGPEGMFIRWPWIVPGDHHRYYSDEILQQVAPLTNVDVASDRTPATAPNVTAEMVDAWRIAFHGSYDGGKGYGDYNDHIRKGLEAAFVRREGEAKSSGTPAPAVRSLLDALNDIAIGRGRCEACGKKADLPSNCVNCDDFHRCRWEPVDPSTVARAAFDAFAALTPATNVSVTPLEWNGNSGRAVMGSYRVSYNVSGQPWGYPERKSGFYAERDIGFGQLVSGPHETRKEAEQSADQDYERRILSALSATATEGE